MADASPFVPGARVVVEANRSYSEDRVLKVHKNGNFTLKSNPSQQWRPYESRTFSGSEPRWRATKTVGGSWHTNNTAYFWAEDDVELIARIAKAQVADRARDLLYRLSRVDPTKVSANSVPLLAAALASIEAERRP